jgi:SIR2-like domain
MPKPDAKRNIVFLLGAGASKDAGLPLAIEITDRIVDDIERSYTSLMPLLRFVHGGICFGRGCSNKKPDDRVNVEEFLIACQDLARRSSSSLYPFVSSWHEKLAEVGRLPPEIEASGETNAFEFVSRHCKQRLREWLTVTDSTKVKYFRNLRDFISEGFRLHVFTLNYDECVELALANELGEINGRWTTGFDHKGWKPDLLDNKKKRYDALLYKLHGSLDWVEDEELGVCSLKWPMAEHAEEIPDTYESLLIFATALKVIPRDPYLSLLVRFRAELYRCECVVILGYSFGDDHVNTMLLDALRKRPTLQCVIANRQKDVSKYLPNVFREEIARERFQNVYDDGPEGPLGVRLALEKDILLRQVKEVCLRSTEEMPF